MPPALREVAPKFAQLLADVSLTSLEVHHVMGRWVWDILHNDGLYGESAVEMLEKYLHCEASQLFDDRNFALKYTAEEVSAFSVMRMHNGEPITFSHLMILGNTSASSRRRLLEKTLGESLTVRQLLREADSLVRTTPFASRRAIRRPPSAVFGVQEIISQSGKMLERFGI